MKKPIRPICDMPNCGRRAPITDVFCSHHRPKPKPKKAKKKP